MGSTVPSQHPARPPLPAGPYLGVLQATAEHGTLLFCVDINFRISLMDGAAVAAA